MKSIKIILRIAFGLLLSFSLYNSTLTAQNDTLYIMKSGVVVSKFNVNTEIDSMIFYQPDIIVSPFSCGDVFTDSRDGNQYQTVQIGSQCWMAENLKYLPNVVGPGTGSNDDPYYYVYGYDGTDVNTAKATANYTTYGVLYNWPAAMNGATSSDLNPSGVQGVCPTGWHLPSDAEWTVLTNYLGDNAGGKLKEAGFAHWAAPNEGATNETGFTALPGGGRYYDGTFYNIGNYGGWWSSTESGIDDAITRLMGYDDGGVSSDYNYKEVGFSVRCLRD